MKVTLPALPNGRAIFCDDIRHEIGGKVSLIGIYTGSMYFPKEATFPLMLPKLGIAVYWHEPFEGYANEITFRTVFAELDAEPLGVDGILLAESHHNLNEMEKRVPQPPIAPAKDEASNVNRIKMLSSYMMLSPFAIPHSGKLRVRAYRNEEILAVGALRIEKAPD